MSFDKIIYRLTDKRIPAATGIGLVGEILERAGFQEQFRNVRSETETLPPKGGRFNSG